MSSFLKRKAGSSLNLDLSKKPRATLELFFSPQVPLPKKSTNNPMGPLHVAMNSEQTRVMRVIINERMSFFTGAAGTGKSLLLRAIIRGLHQKYTKTKDFQWSMDLYFNNCMILQSSSGNPPQGLLKGFKYAQTLFFVILMKLKYGFLLVITGDFFHLLPIMKNNQEPIFAFESQAWQNTLESTVNLTHVFRQKNSTFVSTLNALCFGAPTEDAITLFNSLSQLLQTSSIHPMELYPLHTQVGQSNASHLSVLLSPKILFVTHDSGTQVNLLNNLLAKEHLELKINMQVMLIKNVDEHLVNGVIGWVSNGDHALLKYVCLSDDGKTPVLASDEKENTPSVKLESKPNKKEKEKAVVVEEKYPLVLFKYLLQDGGYESEAVLIKCNKFKVDDAEGKLLACRVQLPLILAWSMLIHKSQGQTIHYIKVDLGCIFEKDENSNSSCHYQSDHNPKYTEQSYVALLYASSIEGLQIVGFNPKKYRVNQLIVGGNGEAPFFVYAADWGLTIAEIEDMYAAGWKSDHGRDWGSGMWEKQDKVQGRTGTMWALLHVNATGTLNTVQIARKLR
ncbi:hypothetical protein BT96DRAFT_1101420 [Gymnopus androsaceus JB14]|uniref:ATP-dependent DNA helicase n=1 Tax=Gymnopus androsaceus JB14 TaxID=1447944 RepID=A0A6A4GF28_9AGAR|nr:hypothetical protein BT96DRAFT_1101420 [Gymnopus androsaceus JB14]